MVGLVWEGAGTPGRLLEGKGFAMGYCGGQNIPGATCASIFVRETGNHARTLGLLSYA